MQTETNMMANITNIIQLTQFIAKIKCLLLYSMYYEKDDNWFWLAINHHQLKQFIKLIKKVT